MALTPEQLKAAIERAKMLVAERTAQAEKRKADHNAKLVADMNLNLATPQNIQLPVIAEGNWKWNTEQTTAIQYGVLRRNFCLIGAAGTGKTTTLRGTLLSMLRAGTIPPLERGTKHLAQGAPGVALISYTRRAVRNIARQMPEELKSHCITFHKLVEYEPHFYEVENEEGELVNKMRFEPSRNQNNPLPRSLTTIVIDEASMLSTDYFNILLDALPDPSQVQFIVLGDINQLPPVYGQAVLGQKLLEFPIVELTQVYRQALESPIISLALAVKNNNFKEFVTDSVDKWGIPAKYHYAPGTVLPAGVKVNPINYAASFDPTSLTEKVEINSPRGKITLHPWKKQLSLEDGLYALQGQLKRWIKDGTLNPDEDLVLCPWDKSFGAAELNLAIADTLRELRGLEVHEIISGFEKKYWAIGDKLMVDKQDAVIVDISRNTKYLGKSPRAPSKNLNRWGAGDDMSAAFGDSDLSNEDIDLMLLHASDVTDRTREASHVVRLKFLDTDEERDVSSSGVFNQADFGYCMTVHKAQGSECRRVFFLTHSCHAAMCSRELVYTAITRAAEEIYILMDPKMLGKAAKKPRIKGDTLAEKLQWYQSRFEEKS